MASKLAVEAIEHRWKNFPPPTDDKEAIWVWLLESVFEANQRVWHKANEALEWNGMGTTIIVGLQSADGTRLQIAHVGHSRAYLVRAGKPSLLTNDHTVDEPVGFAGGLAEQGGLTSPYWNLITRCLGNEEKVETDLTPVEVKPGDWIVLCSDGLTTVLLEKQIGHSVKKRHDPDLVCENLIKQARDGGAPDNVTTVVIHYLD